jgi:hypothetical protein
MSSTRRRARLAQSVPPPKNRCHEPAHMHGSVPPRVAFGAKKGKTRARTWCDQELAPGERSKWLDHTRNDYDCTGDLISPMSEDPLENITMRLWVRNDSYKICCAKQETVMGLLATCVFRYEQNHPHQDPQVSRMMNLSTRTFPVQAIAMLCFRLSLTHFAPFLASGRDNWKLLLTWRRISCTSSCGYGSVGNPTPNGVLLPQPRCAAR